MKYNECFISLWILSLLLVGFLELPGQSSEPARHQITGSFTLGGHIFLGLGYSYYFDAHNAVQGSIFIVPVKPFAFAFNTGYNYYFGNKHWHPNLGAEIVVIASPPDPDKRKSLPLINIVPGIRYDFNPYHSLNGRVWGSYLPSKKPFKIFPTGLEFKYGYNIIKK